MKGLSEGTEVIILPASSMPTAPHGKMTLRGRAFYDIKSHTLGKIVAIHHGLNSHVLYAVQFSKPLDTCGRKIKTLLVEEPYVNHSNLNSVEYWTKNKAVKQLMEQLTQKVSQHASQFRSGHEWDECYPETLTEVEKLLQDAINRINYEV